MRACERTVRSAPLPGVGPLVCDGPGDRVDEPNLGRAVHEAAALQLVQAGGVDLKLCERRFDDSRLLDICGGDDGQSRPTGGRQPVETPAEGLPEPSTCGERIR